MIAWTTVVVVPAGGGQLNTAQAWVIIGACALVILICIGAMIDTAASIDWRGIWNCWRRGR